MKIKDIITESSTDIVARFYKDPTIGSDRHFNPEAVRYKEKNVEYYEKYFGSWYDKEEPPVFEKPVATPQRPYNTTPTGSKVQSPGYRGLQYALAAAGLPYNKNVQGYSPSLANATPSHTMDGSINANGQ